MTTELRRTIEPSDLLAVELECKQCRARTVWPINNWQEKVRMCSNCHALYAGGQTALNVLDELANRFYQLSNLIDKDTPFTVRFELKREEQP